MTSQHPGLGGQPKGYVTNARRVESSGLKGFPNHHLLLSKQKCPYLRLWALGFASASEGKKNLIEDLGLRVLITTHKGSSENLTNQHITSYGTLKNAKSSMSKLLFGDF